MDTPCPGCGLRTLTYNGNYFCRDCDWVAEVDDKRGPLPYGLTEFDLVLLRDLFATDRKGQTYWMLDELGYTDASDD